MSHAEAVAAALAAQRRLALLRALADIPAPDRLRLQILRLLSRFPAYSGNTSEIDMLLDACDIPVSRQTVRAAAAWLAERALVVLEPGEALDALTVTRRGLDVAALPTEPLPGLAPPATPAWLHEALGRLGVRVSVSQVEIWLGELCDAGLVTLDDQVALTRHGEDVAAGRERIDLVATPSPRV